MNIRIEIKDNEKDYRYIRETVFMKEQGFSYDFDHIDPIATHITLFIDDELMGCGRLFPKEEGSTTYLFGRIALLKNTRGKGYGKILINEMEKIAKEEGAKEITLHAQSRAKDFYVKCGYVDFGEEDDDEGVPHQWMRKEL